MAENGLASLALKKVSHDNKFISYISRTRHRACDAQGCTNAVTAGCRGTAQQ